MEDFVFYFFNEMTRDFYYENIHFTYMDVFYCICIFSILGEFIYHFIRQWTSRNG